MRKILAIISGIALAFASIVVIATPAEAATYTQGRKCTIVGSNRNNRIIGTPRNDVICGLGGNDYIDGRGGNDIIDGGNGNDTIIGGAGNDRLIGAAGNDSLNGSAGNDALYGGVGNDGLSGSDGNDAVFGEAGNDSVNGNAGDDAVYGGDGNDSVSGSYGADRVDGGNGNDTLNGNEDNDAVYGGAGNDTMYGAAGDDRLEGGDGNDVERGGAGADGLIGGAGADSLFGSDGGSADAGDVCEAPAGDTVDLCAPDSAAPTLVSVAFNRTSLSTGSADQTLVMTIRVTDDLMGVASVGCGYQFDGGVGSTVLQSFEQNAVRTSGNFLDGIYTCTIVFPQGVAQGAWIPRISYRDNAGRFVTLSAYNNVDWLAVFPDSPTRINQTDVGDTTAPVVQRYFNMSKTTVDTSYRLSVPSAHLASRKFTVDVEVSDNQAGVSEIGCYLTQNQTPDFGGASGTAVRISGTKWSGVWRCTYNYFQDYSAYGDWFLNLVIRDGVGNIKSIRGTAQGVNEGYNGSTLTGNEPSALGRNYIFQAGIRDVVAPTLWGVSITPTSVNTGAAPRSVVMTYYTGESGGAGRASGINASTCWLRLPQVAPANDIRVMGMPARLTWGGRTGTGKWSCTVTLPRGYPAGTWIPEIEVRDNANNVTRVESGLPTVRNG